VAVSFLARLRRARTPSRCFFVCGTPRSGTTLLADLLASTKLAGRAGEFFSAENEPEFAAHDYRKYLEQCVAKTARNGVFGAKLLPGQLEHFLARLRALSRRPDGSDRAVLEAVFPRPRFVFTSRRDVVAQAVSWWKAHQTGEFYVGDPRSTGATPRFDYDEIHALVGEIVEGTEMWRRWFVSNDIEPFAVAYEDLVADKMGITRTVLRFLGIEAPARRSVEETTMKQADEVNSEWIAQYHEIATARGHS
jgi:LPS sulfotransferase NodH